MSVLYHPGKANMVADTLSCMSMGCVSHVEEDKKELVKDVHRLARLGVRLDDSQNGGFMVHHNSDSSLVVEISPMKGVMRFARKGKLSPQYVGPYEVLQRVGKVAYELKLPNELALVHLVFHVSMLKKCIGDPMYILPIEGLGVDENLSYEEVSVEILDRQVKKLRNKEVGSIKVLWRNHLVKGATLEAKDDMKSHYPYLFTPRG
ncbi:uncharacterized protein [Solanum lycopersicum]|uniref:uncharacterized protein n=1 Tax=Solanum lycopersicum TaxID=4081 RepID=UPI0002BCB511